MAAGLEGELSELGPAVVGGLIEGDRVLAAGVGDVVDGLLGAGLRAGDVHLGAVGAGLGEVELPDDVVVGGGGLDGVGPPEVVLPAEVGLVPVLLVAEAVEAGVGVVDDPAVGGDGAAGLAVGGAGVAVLAAAALGVAALDGAAGVRHRLEVGEAAVEEVHVDVAVDAGDLAGARGLEEDPVAPRVGEVGADGAVLGDPERVGGPLGGADLGLPDVLAGVDDRLDAEGCRDVVDPLADRGGDLVRGEAVVGLDVDDGGEDAGAEGAHLLEEEVGLGDRVLGGAEVLVGADDEAVLLGLLPVGGDVVVDVLGAVGDADEGELLAVGGDRGPVDRGLPGGDVDALDGGAVGADDRGEGEVTWLFAQVEGVTHRGAAAGAAAGGGASSASQATRRRRGATRWRRRSMTGRRYDEPGARARRSARAAMPPWCLSFGEG